MKNFPPLIIALALIGTAQTAQAQFRWLFDPTPSDEMRDLSTDRPDTTESPISVDPGHLQVETDLASGYLKYDGTWLGHSLMEVNAKIGLLPFADLQTVFTTYEETRGEDGNGTGGVGDTMFRLKLNLLGNDGGDVAIGFLPMVKIPTGGQGVTVGSPEYGFAVPMGFAAPEGFDVGAMLEIDAVYDGEGRYHGEWLSTLTCGHDIIGPLGFFVEVTNTMVFNRAVEAQGTFNGGLLLAFDNAVQLDTGFNLRTWGNADEDVRLFLGATVRN